TQYMRTIPGPSLREREDALPVRLHVYHSPAPRRGLVQGLVQLADFRGPVVGPFAIAVGVMHEPHEPGALSRGGPLEHLQVAVRVAEGEDGPPPDVPVDPHRLPWPVVDEVRLRLAKQDGACGPHLELRRDRAADGLLRRDPIDPLRPGPHELD